MELTLNFNEEVTGEAVLEFKNQEVSHILSVKLVVRDPEGETEREISFPVVRFVYSDALTSTRPFGPDRAKAWKAASEWLQELVVDQRPTVKVKRYQNRLKAEESYFHNKEDPDLYQWQEDKELLKEIRPRYRNVKEELVDEIGKPSRSDFDRLYPHQYDDPGLSERARRAVRDLKGVFGKGIVVEN